MKLQGVDEIRPHCSGTDGNGQLTRPVEFGANRERTKIVLILLGSVWVPGCRFSVEILGPHRLT